MKYSINDLKVQIQAAKAIGGESTFYLEKIKDGNSKQILGKVITEENPKEDIYPYFLIKYQTPENFVKLYYTFKQLSNLRDDLNLFQEQENYIDTLLLKAKA